MLESIDITLRNRIDEVTRFSGIIDSLWQKYHLPKQDIYAVHLAADELLANIVNYAYPRPGQYNIHVLFEVSRTGASLTITDSGKPFNPLEKEDPDLDKDISEREAGGLGIFLVKNYSQSVDYKRIDNQNVISITFSFTGT